LTTKRVDCDEAELLGSPGEKCHQTNSLNQERSSSPPFGWSEVVLVSGSQSPKKPGGGGFFLEMQNFPEVIEENTCTITCFVSFLKSMNSPRTPKSNRKVKITRNLMKICSKYCKISQFHRYTGEQFLQFHHQLFLGRIVIVQFWFL
jgi:hypothetical protein